jgi:hypothetical protein
MNSLLQNLLAQPRQEPVKVEKITLFSGGREVEITEDGFVVGRADVCDLVVHDPAVADFAATVHLQDGAAWIEITEFAEAVMISGRPYKRLALRDGDELQFGQETWNVALTTNRGLAPQDLEQSSEASLDDEIRELFDMMDWNSAGEEPVAVPAPKFASRLESGVQALLRAALEADLGHAAGSSEEVGPGHVSFATSDMAIDREEIDALRDQHLDLEERTREAQRELEARIELLLDHLSDSTAALRASA